MPNRCCYCGREEGDNDVDGYIHLMDCPVCWTLACPFCLALIEFSEVCEDNSDMVQTWRAAVCKTHLPWNIIEGIKKGTKEEDKDE